MSVRIEKDCLVLDRRLSDAEFQKYEAQIRERTSWGYYQRMVIKDAAGHRLETPGHHLCHGSLVGLERYGFPTDLTGKTVLDIGCNAGFYSVVAKLRGARSVLALDSEAHYIAQAQLLREILGVDVEFRQLDGHQLDERVGSYDVVLNTGVVYHLQNPMDFLARLARITREMMYMESEVLLDARYADYAWFIEGEYCQDRSNWWVYGPRCLERMARAAGFSRVDFAGFVWKPEAGTKTPEGFDRQGRGAFICRK